MSDSLQKIRDLNLSVAHKTGDEIYCHCPFHVDKGASLCINSKKPIWYCQSCERGGYLDKLEKLMQSEGIVEHVETDESTKKHYPLAKMEISDFEELSLARNCQYLVKRKFDNDTIRAWDIRRTTIFAVLPLKNVNDEVEGLILRSMIKDYEPRYQAKHFKKKEKLFGKRTGPEGKLVVLVEGPLDAVKVWQNMKELELLNSFSGVYSAMGSSMAIEQLKLLSKVSNDILILMDNDDAGRLATKKCARSLLGFNLFVPSFKYYKSEDPGEMDKTEFGGVVVSKVPYLKARIEGWL